MHPIRLDAEHRYWVPGPNGERQVPGYSEVCASLGVSKPNPFHTPEGRDEGIALHLWLGFLVRGKIPSSPPDPRIAGRVEGIRKFLQDTKFQIVGGEQPLYDPLHDYACTPDLYGHMGIWSWVIDAKRGAKLKIHSLQTAAQSIALRANGFRAQKRGALYLKDGDYRLDEHTDTADIVRWPVFVNSFHLRGEYNDDKRPCVHP